MHNERLVVWKSGSTSWATLDDRAPKRYPLAKDSRLQMLWPSMVERHQEFKVEWRLSWVEVADRAREQFGKCRVEQRITALPSSCSTAYSLIYVQPHFGSWPPDLPALPFASVWTLLHQWFLFVMLDVVPVLEWRSVPNLVDSQSNASKKKNSDIPRASDHGANRTSRKHERFVILAILLPILSLFACSDHFFATNDVSRSASGAWIIEIDDICLHLQPGSTQYSLSGSFECCTHHTEWNTFLMATFGPQPPYLPTR